MCQLSGNDAQDVTGSSLRGAHDTIVRRRLPRRSIRTKRLSVPLATLFMTLQSNEAIGPSQELDSPARTMSSSPNDTVAVEIRPSPVSEKEPSFEDECCIVITDCEVMVSPEGVPEGSLSSWSRKETASVNDEGDLSRSDSHPRRHHKHRRRHHHHHHRTSQAEDLSVGRCQSRLVIEDDFPSECETVVTTKTESVCPERKEERKRKRKRKKKKRKQKPSEPEEDTEEDEEGKRDKKAELIVVTVSAVILTIALLLIGITLALTPKIDEMVRKENENMFRLPTPSSGLTTIGPALRDNATSVTLTAVG